MKTALWVLTLAVLIATLDNECAGKVSGAGGTPPAGASKRGMMQDARCLHPSNWLVLAAGEGPAQQGEFPNAAAAVNSCQLCEAQPRHPSGGHLLHRCGCDFGYA
jgi:hypothetical protein